MERKIGEIFEYNGKWYQCIVGNGCKNCTFNEERKCYTFTNNNDPIGDCCSERRTDKYSVIFKKLEKVGEPYEFDGHIFQSYRTFEVPIFTENYATVRELGNNSKISIEIKQNKEDMKEKNGIMIPKEDNPLTRIVYNYINGKISDKELIKSIKEMSDEYPYSKNSLKPFNLEEAKAGKPVCTRDGRKARIICFDRLTSDDYSKIVACVTTYDGKDEYILTYGIDGYIVNSQHPQVEDLMMLPEKKEGYVNLYHNCNDKYAASLGNNVIYKDKAFAENMAKGHLNYIKTVKVEWEE